jgi:hypothetical protein
MKITFRIIMIGVAIIGLGFGASFGAGIAYGRSTPKEAESAPTQQQLNSQLGITGSGGTGAAALGTAAAGAAQRGAGGAAALATRGTTGRITAVEGRTITVETRTGNVKVTLAANATIEKVSSGTVSDLKVGDTIVAIGDRNADGSVNATSLAQVPQELQALVGALGGTTPQAGSTPTGR